MWVKWVGKKKLKKNNLNADVENCGSFKGFGYIYIYIYIYIYRLVEPPMERL